MKNLEKRVERLESQVKQLRKDCPEQLLGESDGAYFLRFMEATGMTLEDLVDASWTPEERARMAAKGGLHSPPSGPS